MQERKPQVYGFDDFRLDVANRRLLREGLPVRLPSKAFDMLVLLVERGGRLVGKEELFSRVWPEQVVEESNLAVQVSAIRKALGERKEGRRYIVTVPGHGYRFAGEVLRVDEEEEELVFEHHSVSRLTVETEKGDAGAGAYPVRGRVSAAGERRPSGVEYLFDVINLHRGGVVLSLLFLSVAVAGGAFAWSKFGRQQPPPEPSPPFHSIRLAKLTTTGNATHASVSPDGKYVVHVVNDAGRQSLWTNQVATDSTLQLVPPANVTYWGITFSHDGSYVYYVTREPGSGLGLLYRVSTLRGPAIKLLEDIDSPITISPDGQRMAFVRWNPDQRESGLWVANIDGTSERKLATRRDPETFGRWGAFGVNGGPAWSPDGKVIACGVSGFENGAYYGTVAEVRVEDGAQSLITSHRWARGGRVAWLGDGSGLVMSAVDVASGPNSQLWYLSYPGGAARRITSDLNDYADVTATGDSKALVAVQTDMRSQVWVAPGGDAARAKQITSGTYEGIGGLTWTADGRLVYISRGSSNNVALWVVDGDGDNQRQVTSDASAKYDPAVSPDGRYVVFSSNRTGSFHLWRINADGSDLKQLTDGEGEHTPAFSADGRWVVYYVRGNKKSLWKVSVDGGTPTPLGGLLDASLPAVSPDGRLIACWTYAAANDPAEGRRASRFQLGIIPFAGGQPARIIEISPTADHSQRFQWTADGSAVVYPDKRGGISNLWSQPLGGGGTKQLTNFDSEQIFAFAWSRDGKLLAVARGAHTADVIMITAVAPTGE